MAVSTTPYVYPIDLVQGDDYGHLIQFRAYSAATFATNLYSRRELLDDFLLYTPGGGQNNLLYSQTHEYDEVKMSRLGAGIASAIVGVGGSDLVGQGVGAAAGLFRKAINPRIEVLFRSTELRTFDFSFMFAPQSEAEARSLTEMLNRFRYHAAPRLQAANFLFESPSEWQIFFYYRDAKSGQWRENNKLPKIATSVCARIDVDMNPDSEFSTFDDGTSVSSRLTMRFIEMEIIDKDRIAGGF